MNIAGDHVEVLDAQIIFHPREAPELGLEAGAKEAMIVELALLAMQSVGVDGAVWHGEASLCQTAAERYPDVFRGIVYHDDIDVTDMAEQLMRIKAHPGLSGVRLTPAWPWTGENIERLRAGHYEPWLAEAERLDLPLSFFVSGHLREVPAVAEAHPGLRILIDHIGMNPAPHVPLTPDRLEPLPDLLALSRYENVAVKLTGVPALSYEPYPFADLWPACHRILEAFGLERVMWGSDFRRIRSLHSYAELVDFLKLTDELSVADKRKLFADSLRSWLGWERGS